MAETMADEEHLRNLVEKIAEEQKVENCKIQIKPINSGGANYSSKLYFINITGEGSINLQLFGKVATMGEIMRNQTPIQGFNNEQVVYTELMKIYRELEDKHRVPEEHLLKVPKYYGADLTYLQEVLVLEDLSSKGFGAADRFQSVDWKYAAAAVTELAKFHALSIAYEHEYPKEFEHTLKKFATGIYKDVKETRAFLDGSFKAALATVREENRERLKSFLDGQTVVTYGDAYRALKRKALIHVDFRPSNMLHKVRDDGTIEVFVVDFQTIQGGSPVLDLIYFIFCATDGQFRKQHYQELVEHYYSELGAALARLGLDVKDKYSREDFDFDLKEKLSFGLLVAVLVLPIVMISEEEAPTVGDEMNIATMLVQNKGVEFQRRMNEIVDEFVAWGIL